MGTSNSTDAKAYCNVWGLRQRDWRGLQGLPEACAYFSLVLDWHGGRGRTRERSPGTSEASLIPSSSRSH